MRGSSVASSRVSPANSRVTFDIALLRLPSPAPWPGLIDLTVRRAGENGRPARLGSLTDAALRARLAHFDAHSANEIAALRKALQPEGGEFALTESWKDRDEFLRHWYGFLGSMVHSTDWKCEACGDAGVERLARASGEVVHVRCARGHAVAIAGIK